MERGISARSTNKLSDRGIKAFIAKGGAGRKKIADGGGLYLKIMPTGGAVWRIKYRYNEKEKTYAGIGPYPEISLEAARAEREQLRAHLRAGHDPMERREVRMASAAVAADNTFEPVAREWLAKRKKDWSPVHYDKSKRALERDVFPTIGRLPMSEITPAMIAGIIMAIVDRRGARDTASKILQHVNGIFRHGQAHGCCRDNPADPVREVLPRKKQTDRRAAILEWAGLGDILRRAELARLSPAVRVAHRLCAFTLMRISNVVAADWKEFDLDAEVPRWTIPRTKMKSKDRTHDHTVILGETIAAELRAWRALTGGKGYVCPSSSSEAGHITRESIEKAYRETLGLADKHSPHGWRAAFATLARDNSFERDAAELTLDHIHDTDVVRAYDRGERLEQRIKLMQWWDAELAQAQRGADVVPMHKKKA